MRAFLLAMCLAAAATAAEAQERPLADADLPRGVEEKLTAIIEHPDTRKITGEVTINEAQGGNVVVFNGPLTLGSKIDGQLIVVDGDVRFEAGAEVVGDVTVIGGEAFNLENATIGGTVTLYGEGFTPFDRDDRLLAVNSRTRRVYREDDHRDWGHSTLSLHTGWNYNRVEGLPIQFGPIIETSGRNPTRVEAHAIWRTEVSGPFESEDWGYALRAEQFFGGRRDFRLGGTFKSVIEPIEDWQLTKSEASLATFVLHSDYRDYFEREGWSAYARYAPRATGFSATVEYSVEDHTTQPARDPWTLFSNGDDWRLQPLVAEGRFRSVNAALQLDRRNDTDFPSAGFLVRAEVTRGTGGSLAIPAANPWSDAGALADAIPVNPRFTRGLVDARVYRRVGHDATLSLRAVGGGAFSNEALPPQFQHALGGAGSLPGYSLFSADCGARRSPVIRASAGENNSYYPYYGCDRIALFSAEYRGGFDFHFGGVNFWDDEEDADSDEWGWHVDANPNWIVFFDAARGWASREAELRGAADTPNLYDVGAGILLGDFGIYGAVPLTGTDRAMKFFIRLGARF